MKNMSEAIHLEDLHNKEEILDALIQLGNSLFDQTVNTTEQLELLSTKYSTRANVLVLSADTRVIGLCAYYDNNITEKEAYISMLVVDQNEQGKGYGTRLIREVTECCARNKMKYISLCVSKHNSKAIEFYKANGFNLFQKDNNRLIYRKAITAQ